MDFTKEDIEIIEESLIMLIRINAYLITKHDKVELIKDNEKCMSLINYIEGWKKYV